MQNIQVAMIIERSVATIWVDTYEKKCRFFGAILVTITLLLTVFETGNGYSDILANYLMTNSLMITESTATKVTTAFAVIFVVCCISLLIIISQYCFSLHRRKRKRYLENFRRTLTSRYQNSENIFTSGMLCVISSIQLTTFAIYGFFMTYLRLVLYDSPMYDPYKECVYTVPLCTLLLPLAAIICIEVSKRKRLNGIQSMVMMPTSGTEGWQNYEQQLRQQWS
ncbi:hypothetical protein COOONC_14479 [Cooperia oncophora]